MNEDRPPADRDETIDHLRRILQALAAPSERQRVLFPEFVVRGDELALQFDRWYHILIGHGYESTLPHEGVGLLSEIDGIFGRMVDAHEHVWSAEGAHESGDWVALRGLAQRALERLGWPPENPSPLEEDGLRG